MHPESIAVRSGRPARSHRAPVNTPIVLSAPFHHGPDDNYYVRQGSSDNDPAFEQAVATWRWHGFGVRVRMAAIAAVVEGQPAGRSPVVRSRVTIHRHDSPPRKKLGRMSVREVDVTDTPGRAGGADGAALLWLESPTNPLLGVRLPVLIDAAHAAGAIVAG